MSIVPPPNPPYYQDATATLHHGDCLDVLRSLPDASVDAVVTDPPYGLANTDPAHVAETITRWVNGERDYLPGGAGFMGKAWDAFVPPVAVWDDCLRVLKPGGHVLAFAGSRTVDLMTLGLRLAGFDIRDSIAWLYGSGFPKSLDVSKAIDKARTEDREPVRAVCAFLRDAHRANPRPRREIDAHFGTKNIGGHWFTPDSPLAQCPTWEQWLWLRDWLGFGDEMDAEVWRLNGRKGKPGDNYEAREVIGEGVAGLTAGSIANFRGSKTFDITAPATDAARTWQGWGTALKPAFEPVVVARKPLAGTVAQNVLTYGTGALNIDACRINAFGQSPEPPTSQGDGRSSRGDNTTCTCPELADDRTSRTTSTPPLASSDASLAGHSDLPASAPRGESDRPQPLDSPVGYQSSPRSGDAPAREAAEDDQASPQPRPDADKSPARCATCGHNRSTQSMPYDHSTTPHVQREATRTGEASADRRYTERGGTNFAPLPGVRGGDPAGRWPANVVLDESQAAALDEQSGDTPLGGSSGSRNPDENRTVYGGFTAGTERERHNFGDSGGASRFFYVAKADASERVRVNGTAHPTVKPLALMRWLVRLVTPPGGTVLEPFAGSGTTVEACILEGFKCIAIEREADYLPLIVQRINRRRNPVEAVKSAGEDAGLFDLLGEVGA